MILRDLHYQHAKQPAPRRFWLFVLVWGLPVPRAGSHGDQAQRAAAEVRCSELERERDELREALTAAEANIAASFDEGPVHTQTYIMDWTPANPTPQTEEGDNG